LGSADFYMHNLSDTYKIQNYHDQIVLFNNDNH